jgi:hypothetical protein
MSCHSGTSRWHHCPSRRGGATLGKVSGVVAQAFPPLQLAVAHLPLLAGAGVRALEVVDEDSAQIHIVVDFPVGQVLEPCPRGVAEVERQILDDEEIIYRSARMARELVVFQPHTGVSVSVISRDVGWSSKM